MPTNLWRVTPAVRAVIFDFDGVLVDSEPSHFRALRDCLVPEGVSIDEEDYRTKLLAYDDHTAIRIALGQAGLEVDPARVARAAERKADCYQREVDRVEWFPGARELVSRLECPLAIASGARRDEIERVLEVAGLRDRFAALVSADDVEHTKPHPAPYLRACAELAAGESGLAPAECVAFEDSPPGIASARSAGMRVIAVTNSYPEERLGLAHRIIGSLCEVERASLKQWAAEPG